MKLGFIGLGNVGGKLAGSLLRNGFDLTVHDLNRELVAEFIERGAATVDGPLALMQACDDEASEFRRLRERSKTEHPDFTGRLQFDFSSRVARSPVPVLFQAPSPHPPFSSLLAEHLTTADG